MEKDLLIKQDLDLGLSWDKIAKKYGIGKSTIKKVLTQGKYYYDINTGEVLFTSKTIKENEQKFNYLCYCDMRANGNVFKYHQSKIFKDRAINPRLADFLGVNSSQTHRWSKKEQRLIECNSDGMIDNSFVVLAGEFLHNEMYHFLKNRPYEFDDNGYLRGYKLWYINLTPELLYYAKKYAFAYVNWKKENKDKSSREFGEYVKENFKDNEYLYYNTRVGIILGKWIIKNMKTYTYDYIKEVINYSSKGWWEEVEDIDYDLILPPILYIEKYAYYSGLLNKEQMTFVEKYM